MDDVVVSAGMCRLCSSIRGLWWRGYDHVGTIGFDVGLNLSLLDAATVPLAVHLQDAEFAPDQIYEGRAIRRRWGPGRIGHGVFFLQPSIPSDQSGRLRDIEKDFAAIIGARLEARVSGSAMGPDRRQDILRHECGQ